MLLLSYACHFTTKESFVQASECQKRQGITLAPCRRCSCCEGMCLCARRGLWKLTSTMINFSDTMAETGFLVRPVCNCCTWLNSRTRRLFYLRCMHRAQLCLPYWLAAHTPFFCPASALPSFAV